MQFILNVERLEEMSAVIMNASQTIVDSALVLNSILSHDDWYCKEKSSIDERILAVKNNASALKQSMEEFSSYLISVATSFRSMMQEEEKELALIDSELASISSILDGPGGSVIECGSNIANAKGALCDKTTDASVMDYFTGIDKPISISEFV